jgi:hypothetical protein
VGLWVKAGLNWLHVGSNDYVFVYLLRTNFFIPHLCYVYLGDFAKLRKATLHFLMSVCSSVLPRETTRLPLDTFLRNLVFELLSKTSLIKIN